MRDGFRFEPGPSSRYAAGPRLRTPLRRARDAPSGSAILPAGGGSGYRRAGSSEWTVITPEDRARRADQGLTPFDLWGLDDAQREAATRIMARMVSLTRDQLDELDD
ncbi:MAG: hypothetical protein M5U14_09450 [Acidimicrobiia bacterium]|nr:hypothetical protein [Acidimicrobiia bacterium]